MQDDKNNNIQTSKIQNCNSEHSQNVYVYIYIYKQGVANCGDQFAHRG